MKKIFLTAAIAVFGFSNMNAQDIRYGVKGGGNLATIAGDFGENDTFHPLGTGNARLKVGFHIGGLAEIMLSQGFALQPELLFSSQGYKTDFLDDDVKNIDNNVTLNYVHMPIMAKLFPIENLAIELGPQVGFLISAKNEGIDYWNDLPDNDQVKQKAKDLYKGVDFGLNFGVSYELYSGLFFSARYNLGLTKVDDDSFYYNSGEITSSKFSRKNRVIQLSAGFMF